jgi:predicted enzyme related to lactoylglutathione lyase
MAQQTQDPYEVAAASDLGFNGGLTIAFQTTDRKKSTAWYQENLGFQLLYDVEEIGWCELASPVHRVNIGLSTVEKPKVGGPVPTFGVTDIDAARRKLEARKVRFDGDTVEIPGMVKLATFYDPDGNALMLFQELQAP